MAISQSAQTVTVQFTQILDILQAIFKMEKIKYLLLTGATAVDIRQSLVDEFNEDDSIPCFLLSTKAGGMGINLTAASVVILCVCISRDIWFSVSETPSKLRHGLQPAQ